jgi:hypothetical protein
VEIKHAATVAQTTGRRKEMALMITPKRIAAIAAATAAIGAFGPLGTADAAPAPAPSGWQAGMDAALDGWEAGAAGWQAGMDAAQAGWQAGAAGWQAGANAAIAAWQSVFGSPVPAHR